MLYSIPKSFFLGLNTSAIISHIRAQNVGAELHGMHIFRDVWKAWKKGLKFEGEK
jgi:hypothetical protein